jgi:hypothetical protein
LCACQQFDFLVDDDQLEDACQYAEKQRFRPTDNIRNRVTHQGEYETVARHFGSGVDRVNLFPASFAGFRANELHHVPMNLEDSLPPVYVLTTTPACLAACFVRIIARSTSPTSSFFQTRLCTVLTYNLFDMSYEGDYMDFEEENQEEIDREIKAGLELFRKWEGWREDEMWIADALEAIIQGKGHYRYLPGPPSNI